MAGRTNPKPAYDPVGGRVGLLGDPQGSLNKELWVAGWGCGPIRAAWNMPLEHLPTLRGHLMGQSGSFGQARRAARCATSGKRRNAPDEPLWPIK